MEKQTKDIIENSENMEAIVKEIDKIIAGLYLAVEDNDITKENLDDDIVSCLKDEVVKLIKDEILGIG